MISIIVNNYNYGRFLGDAIDSALRQIDCVVEVIVVDDGSLDHSRDVMLSYSNRIVPVFKANGGQASALNAGFARSRGQGVIFLDADDVLQPGIARRVQDVLDRQPQAAKIQYRMEVIDALGRRTGQLKPAPHLPLPNGDVRRQTLNFPFDLTWTAMSANAFPRAVLERIMPIPASNSYGRAGADWYLVHLAPLFGGVVSLPDVGARYRVHEGNHYEVAAPQIDLHRLRQTIAYARQTLIYIQQTADRLQLPDRPRESLPVSYIANRLMSLKLDPQQHPMPEDTVSHLLWLGLRAASRRFDLTLPMRLLFAAWFVLTACAPRSLTRWLAVQFMFPRARGRFNALLKAGHRTLKERAS
jgi:glycosyltransferase involved in cell wall biosynthesis